MASNRQIQPIQSRRDSTESTSALWEKVHQQFPSKKQNAPFADENNDSLDDNPTIDDNDEYESESGTSLPIQTSPSNLDINKKFQP
ncbi:unnamed protein product, partial [Rotaria sordida]